MRQALCVLLLAAALLGLSSCGPVFLAPAERPAEPAEQAVQPAGQAVESAAPEATPPAETGPDPLEEKWRACFFGGAEGQSESGERVYLAYDELESMSAAALILLDAEGGEILNYVLGEVETEGDSRRILDVEEDVSLPFTILDTGGENGFSLRFKDGDTAAMRIVESDEIIADMMAIIHSLG